MSVLDCVRIIVYRVNKKGLEIFLVNEDKDHWSIPMSHGTFSKQDASKDFISLEPQRLKDGSIEHIFAIEGDWHDIPSIRSIIKEDVKIVKAQIKQHLPDLEQGAFVAVKEAVKKVMPHEYSMLKELKDIIIDRNSVKYI